MAGVGPGFCPHRNAQPEKKINFANRQFFAVPTFVFCIFACFDTVFPAEKPPVGAFFIKAFDPALTLGNHTRIESFMLRQTVHDQQSKMRISR